MSTIGSNEDTVSRSDMEGGKLRWLVVLDGMGRSLRIELGVRQVRSTTRGRVELGDGEIRD